jgi:hypothetical protein
VATKGKGSPRRAASPANNWLDRRGPAVFLTAVLGLALIAGGLYAFRVTPERAWQQVQTWPSAAWGAAQDAGEKVSDSRCALGTCSEKTKASDALAGLRVQPESHATTYRRARFGDAWTDVDKNGCDTRDDMLRRDLADEVTRATKACRIGAPVTGHFTDPYSGEAVTFNKAEAIQVQIDHVVSLGEAWRSGAFAWTDPQRLAYANDPAVLVTTTQKINDAKSDHDAAFTWRQCVRRGPTGTRCTGWQDDRPTGARGCTYATRVITIKKKYDLSVDPAEFDALGKLLGSCS